MKILKGAFINIRKSKWISGLPVIFRGLLGYARWENFERVIEKAKTACEIAGFEASDHFLDITKIVSSFGDDRKRFGFLILWGVT